MSVHDLSVIHFRNLHLEKLKLDQVTWIYGNNGAGKTSLLEALYFLLTRKSFRTSLQKKLVHNEKDHFILQSQLKIQRPVSLKAIWKKDADLTFELSGSPLHNRKELLEIQPVLTMHHQSDALITGSSELRRHFLDWIGFHLLPDFYHAWLRYRAAIKQRNQCLKLRQSFSELDSWDQLLLETGLILAEQRQQAFQILETTFFSAVERYPIFNFVVELSFLPGTEENFSEQIKKNRTRDWERGFTSVGPHRDDWVLTVNRQPIKDVFSRGQIKRTTIFLILVQAILMQEHVGRAPLLLIDDIYSELDRQSSDLVLSSLSDLNSQMILTCLTKEHLSSAVDSSLIYHIENGSILSS